jgi:dipeptidyl aminopeptidase/acylaminoacyl peptidase
MSWRSRAAVIFFAALCAACARNPKPEEKLSPLTLPARVGAAPPGSATSSSATGVNSSGFDRFDLQRMFKRLTDLSFMTQLGSEMIVRKVTYSGADKLPIPAYFFAPRDTSRRRAALIFVHDGIHGDLSDTYVPLIRSLVRDGYVIVAPEYRGSTGYGKEFYDLIDYGGKEVDDVLLAREFLRDVVPYADLGRLGIIGWSHGGFITLHSIFRRPEFFRVAVAHVPVADLPARMRTHDASYQSLFSSQSAYGGTYSERPQPYIARSPVAHVRELKTPLLVHAASNDDDVFIIENRNLRDSMVAAGKERAGLYRYREFADPPGGHGFNRIQTREGIESWNETLVFLRKYLHPERAPRSANAKTPLH